MSDGNREPFERAEVLDQPGIVGARWWQKSLQDSTTTNRRGALIALLSVGGAIVMCGAVSWLAGSGGGDDYRTENRRSLEMQREFGWSFGATGDALTFDGESKRAFDRAALARMADELRPARGDLVPYYVPTLFQSPSALPRSTPKDDPGTVTPLRDALRPIFTPQMAAAYERGKGLASLFKGVGAAAALVVDLSGPESVAFAAGAADVLDPAFTFDNWPHPRGVVPAHLTLAAAAYYQPLFARHPATRGDAPPLFVLDRRRIDAYTDDSTQFDNRHVARLPDAATMKKLGVRRVLYVTPTAFDATELDDLNDEFVAWAAAGLDVKMVAASAFSPDPAWGAPPGWNPDDGRPCYYGGSPRTHLWFWRDYPWAPLPAGERPEAASVPGSGKSYAPQPRATAYSSGRLRGPRPLPANFGTVPVLIVGSSGLVAGARLSRSGSWNRSSGGWGG